MLWPGLAWLWRRYHMLCTSGFMADVIWRHVDTLQRRHCIVVRRLTPLLRRIGRVVSQRTAGAMTKRIRHARCAGGGACNALLPCTHRCVA